MFIIGPRISDIFDRYTDKMDSDAILRLIRPPSTFTIFLIGMWFILQVITISDHYSGLIVSIGLTATLLIWSRTFYISGRKIIKGIVEYRYDENIVPIALNFWTFGTIVLGISFLFEIWSIDITPILASAGVAGIVIGLAARETISNFFGSIALYADDTYQKGDYIELDSKEAEGFVRDISIRSTQLRTLDNNIITVPNSELHKSIIKNKSDPTNPHRIELEVGVTYDSNPEYTREVIDNAIQRKIDDGENMISRSIDNYKIYVKNFADSSINYRIYLWIKHPHQRPIVTDSIYELVYNELAEKDIEIPYPHRKIMIEGNNSDIKDDENFIE